MLFKTNKPVAASWTDVLESQTRCPVFTSKGNKKHLSGNNSVIMVQGMRCKIPTNLT